MKVWRFHILRIFVSWFLVCSVLIYVCLSLVCLKEAGACVHFHLLSSGIWTFLLLHFRRYKCRIRFDSGAVCIDGLFGPAFIITF